VNGPLPGFRRQPLHRALWPAVPSALLGVLAVGLAGGASAAWDCRVADGGGWDCAQAGEFDDTPSAATTPASAAAPQPAGTVAEPATAVPAPAETGRQASPTPIAPDPGPGPAAAKLPTSGQTPTPPASVQEAGPARTTAPVADTPAETRRETAPAADPDDRSISASPGPDRDTYWQSCPAPAPTAEVAAEVDRDAPVFIEADAATALLDSERLSLSGDVRLTQDGLELQADTVTYDRVGGQLSAEGGLRMKMPDLQIAGRSAEYRLETGQGTVTGPTYRVPSMGARGAAERAELMGPGLTRYERISYSTCAPGQDDWLLEADTLALDHDEGLGTATHAKLSFLGVPLLYAPTFTFPIDDRRRSGLLVPSIGTSDSNGVDVSVPYYLNLAPNYDLTLAPRLMSKRGAMLGGEFRFLTGSTEGTLAAEILPNDREYDGDGLRGSASLYTQTWFNERTEAALRLNYLSDDDYLDDLGDSLAVTSATHVERTGELRYHGDYWQLTGRAQYYQTLDNTLTTAERPYSRLPQLRVDLERPDGIAGTTYHLAAEYVNFYRRDSVRGHRLDLFPAVSLPLADSWRYIEPKIGARYTAYRLSDQTPGDDDSPSEFSGLFSVDSGLYFDRATQYFGTGATQTLEPRLYYLLVPNGGQDDQPVFDAALLDFSFDNLFRENRYAGADRFGDANQLTLALTTRFLGNDSGEELLRASIGQIVYFDDREVGLPGEPVEDNDTSALVTELDAALGGGWRTRAGLQWDPYDGDDGTIDQVLAQLTYRDARRERVFNAAYRLRDGIVQETDLAAIWPLNEQVSLIGRHNYSLRENRLLEALAGVEYGRCCWRIRALLRQYVNGSGDDDNLAVMLQLELNGLGRLGDNIDAALERGIYGYR
jgi:LPS-assembly protein